jgi:hypothetical protein
MQEARIRKLYCYLQDNPGGTETDPIFSASPAATITVQDIANWNAGGAVPNLQQVTNQGFTTSNPLISETEVIGETIGVRVDNGSGSIGGQIAGNALTQGRNYELPDKSGTFALLSDILPEADTLNTVVLKGSYSSKPISFLASSSTPATGDPIGAIGIHLPTYSYYWGDFSQAATGLYNVGISYGALQKLTSGDYNIGIGVFAGKELTTGKSNTLIGGLAGQKTTVGNYNTMFGRQAGNENTTGYKNTYFGTYAGYSNITSNLNVIIGYKAGNQTAMGDRNLFLGSFAGQGVTGSNNLLLGVGAGNGDGAISNRLIIHNNTTLSGYGALDNQEGTLGSPNQGNLANALITGAFDQRWVKLNGYLVIGSAYMPNAQGDATYTKNIVAKPDGTIGWENKATSGGLKPSIKILDYTQDATNYILRVSSSQGNPITSYGSPYFEVGIHSTPVIAQNITVQEDLINQLTGTNSNVPMQGRVSTILIPKATNTSPAWNNDIVGIIVTLLAVDNGDGGASSPYNPRRIASDVDLIGNIRPKVKDLYDKYTGIRDVTYTSDVTNYYIDGRLDIGVQGMLANGNALTLESFYFNGSVQTGTGITATNSTSGNFVNQLNVPDVNGGLTSMGYTTIPFRVTIPKATNAAPGYNNGGAILSFVLRYSNFSLTHPNIVVPYSLPALFTVAKQDAFTEIKEFSDTFSGTTITLTNTPKANTIVNVIQDGLVLRQGAGRDYTISGNTITFSASKTNVNIEVNYKY